MKFIRRNRGLNPNMEKLYAVILAAGQGTRMKSGKHKVLHPDCGKPIIDHILDALCRIGVDETVDRKSTRLNSSHVKISYAVFCLKKKKNNPTERASR